MKAWILGLALTVIAFTASAQSDHYVNGYTKADGTYVAPHYQTSPNSTRDDNYSTRGNVNPYTGQEGTKPRDGEAQTPRGQSSYGQIPPNSSYASPQDPSQYVH